MLARKLILDFHTLKVIIKGIEGHKCMEVVFIILKIALTCTKYFALTTKIAGSLAILREVVLVVRIVTEVIEVVAIL